jgi:uncharacterized protein YjfI (DUF2170 family)
MTSQEKLQQLVNELRGRCTKGGMEIQLEVIKADEMDVLIVQLEDREEFPIYVTVDNSQILCICYLWTEEDVKKARRGEMLDAMLTMNVPMPLSSFGKVGGQYLIFGALSSQADLNDIIDELDVLSSNTLIAVEEMAEFLV